MTEPKQKHYKHWRIEILDADDETVDVDHVPTKREAMKMVNRLLKDENLWKIELKHQRVNYTEFEDIVSSGDIVGIDTISSESFKGKALVEDQIERMEEKTKEVIYELFA
tara:strand:+ start:147 stop:476 length:330 start_codon:yes stop_codon:yes gene_type:complete